MRCCCIDRRFNLHFFFVLSGGTGFVLGGIVGISDFQLYLIDRWIHVLSWQASSICAAGGHARIAIVGLLFGILRPARLIA